MATHTYALLAVSGAAYDEIRAALAKAGYDHTFITGGAGQKDERIDMHGIALTRQTPALAAEGRARTLQAMRGARVAEPTNLFPGDEVLLIEGRGCWQERKLVNGDVFFPDEAALQLLSPSYHRIKFGWTGFRSQAGRPIFLTEDPMIGEPTMPYAETLLPAHWQAPVGA